MNRLDYAVIALQNRLNEFLSEERGDTNFVSMLLIIGIVVVLAAAFLLLGDTVMARVSSAVTSFLDGLEI